MKSSFFSLAALVAFAAFAQQGTYWEARCVNENIVITNSLRQDEAQSAANRHTLQTGHTTQVSPKPRGKSKEERPR